MIRITKGRKYLTTDPKIRVTHVGSLDCFRKTQRDLPELCRSHLLIRSGSSSHSYSYSFFYVMKPEVRGTSRDPRKCCPTFIIVEQSGFVLSIPNGNARSSISPLNSTLGVGCWAFGVLTVSFATHQSLLTYHESPSSFLLLRYLVADYNRS